MLGPPPLGPQLQSQSQLQPNPPPNPNSYPGQDINVIPMTADYTTGYPQNQMMTPQMGYQDQQNVGYMPNPPDQPQSQGQAQRGAGGRYVFQADGTQVYIPFQ